MLGRSLVQPLTAYLQADEPQEFSINSYQVPFSVDKIRRQRMVQAGRNNRTQVEQLGFTYVSLLYLVGLLCGWCCVCVLTSSLLTFYCYHCHRLALPSQKYAWVFQYSMANNDSVLFTRVNRIHDLCLISFVLYFQVIRYKMRLLNKTLKTKFLQIEDFSIKLGRLGVTSASDLALLTDRLKQLLASHITPNTELHESIKENLRVHLVFDISALYTLMRRRDGLRLEYRRTLQRLYKQGIYKQSHIDEAYTQFERNLLACELAYLSTLEKLKTTRHRHLTHVMVFFFDRRLRNRFLKKYQNTFNQGLLSQKKKSAKESLQLNEPILSVEKPQYYEDLVQPNTMMTLQAQLRRKQRSGHMIVLASLFLYGMVSLLLGIVYIKDLYQHSQLFCLVSVLAGLMVDPILRQVVRLENYRSKSEWVCSFMVLSCLSKFMVVALLPVLLTFLLRPNYQQFLEQNSLNALISTSVYSLAVVLLFWMDLPYRLQCIWLAILGWSPFFSFTLRKDQSEANQHYRRPAIHMGSVYSDIILIHWMTMFYLPMTPLVILVQLIFLSLFWVSLRMRMLRHTNLPLLNSYRITKVCIFLLEVSLVLSSTVTFVLYMCYGVSLEASQLVSFLLGLLYQFCPTGKINAYFFNRSQFVVPRQEQQILNKFLLQENIRLFDPSQDHLENSIQL